MLFNPSNYGGQIHDKEIACRTHTKIAHQRQNFSYPPCNLKLHKCECFIMQERRPVGVIAARVVHYVVVILLFSANNFTAI